MKGYSMGDLILLLGRRAMPVSLTVLKERDSEADRFYLNAPHGGY